jgi:hypothetical protein
MTARKKKRGDTTSSPRSSRAFLFVAFLHTYTDLIYTSTLKVLASQQRGRKERKRKNRRGDDMYALYDDTQKKKTRAKET